MRDDRDDEGVRTRGEEVDWLKVDEATAGKEPVERGRVDADSEDLDRYAEKSKAGGRKKPVVTGLRLAGVHAMPCVEVGDAGSEAQDDVSRSARRQA